jgi:hypothetical protein
LYRFVYFNRIDYITNTAAKSDIDGVRSFAFCTESLGKIEHPCEKIKHFEQILPSQPLITIHFHASYTPYLIPSLSLLSRITFRSDFMIELICATNDTNTS